MSETGKDYTVNAELPGMKNEDVKVDDDDKHVTISAETKE